MRNQRRSYVKNVPWYLKIFLWVSLILILGSIFRKPQEFLWGRWCYSILLALFSLLNILNNIIIAIRGLAGHKTASMIPFIGGMTGFLAIGMLPIPCLWSLCWVPMVLDASVWAFICALPLVVNDIFFVSYTIKIEDGFLLFLRKGVIFQKIPVSEICHCEKSGGAIKVWWGNYSICSFGTKWENANEVYAMLKKVVNNNSKHTIATPKVCGMASGRSKDNV